MKQLIKKNLTKQDIADKINLKLGFSKEEAKSFIESLFAIIENKVISGEEVKIPKLGNFSSKEKKKDMGETPKQVKVQLLKKKSS